MKKGNSNILETLGIFDIDKTLRLIILLEDLFSMMIPNNVSALIYLNISAIIYWSHIDCVFIYIPPQPHPLTSILHSCDYLQSTRIYANMTDTQTHMSTRNDHAPNNICAMKVRRSCFLWCSTDAVYMRCRQSDCLYNYNSCSAMWGRERECSGLVGGLAVRHLYQAEYSSSCKTTNTYCQLNKINVAHECYGEVFAECVQRGSQNYYILLIAINHRASDFVDYGGLRLRFEFAIYPYIRFYL